MCYYWIEKYSLTLQCTLQAVEDHILNLLLDTHINKKCLYLCQTNVTADPGVLTTLSFLPVCAPSENPEITTILAGVIFMYTCLS